MRVDTNHTKPGCRRCSSSTYSVLIRPAAPRGRRAYKGVRMRVKLLLAAVWLALTAGAAAAQVPTGTISGRVLDQGGDGVPGATVTATSPNLQGERSVVTSMYGDYSIPLLPPGDYTVAIELSGFQTVMRRTPVAPTQTVSLDVTLTVG